MYAPIESGRGFYTHYRKKAMALWTFKCYVDGTQPNLWQAWYDAHPEVQGSHDSIFGIIEQQPQWTNDKYTKKLSNGVIEVRLNGSPKWRIFGHYGDGRREFVVTAIGWHKGKQYKPQGVVGLAAIRRGEIESGTANAAACRRPE